MLGEPLQWTCIHPGGVEILLIFFCYRNWPDGPLGLYTDFTYPIYLSEKLQVKLTKLALSPNSNLYSFLSINAWSMTWGDIVTWILCTARMYKSNWTEMSLMLEACILTHLKPHSGSHISKDLVVSHEIYASSRTNNKFVNPSIYLFKCILLTLLYWYLTNKSQHNFKRRPWIK